MKTLWDRVQRIETLMVQAAAINHRELATKHLSDFGIKRGIHENLLIRMGSGFDPGCIQAEDYHRRYPFSSKERIGAALSEMEKQLAWAEQLQGDAYRFTKLGVKIVTTWMHNMGAMIMTSPLGSLQKDDVDRLIEYDLRILEAMEARERPHNRHVFQSRLKGIQPDYRTPEMWHHWQLVWTMICCREDEEIFIQKRTSLTPLEWFIRRQLSFIDLRPWLVRGPLNVDFLARRANGYSPLDDPEREVRAALDELNTRGWLVEMEGQFRLNEAGMAAFEKDEGLVERNFEALWPDFGEETEAFEDLLLRFNQHFESLMQQG